MIRSTAFAAFALASLVALAPLAACVGTSSDPSVSPAPTGPVAEGGVPPGNGGDSGAGPTPEGGPGPGTDGSAPTGLVDPTKDGPYPTATLDATANVAASGDAVPIHCVYPTSASGPFPVVVVAHGFQIAASEYYGYVKRLASFGYVALTADYPAGFTSVSNVRDAQNLVGALDWADSAPQLKGKVSVAKSGVMGHSRGGKAAFLAAATDTRFAAVLGLDPVDTAPPGGCNAVTECPDSRDALASRSLPSHLIGETTDSSGGSFGMSCAPAAGNYTTYTAKAHSPSVEVTVVGANHMSFIDDVAACGLTCSVCNAATAAQAKVLDLTYAMSVAFFERYLRGNAGYQTYLDGAMAKALWVTPGLATLKSK